VKIICEGHHRVGVELNHTGDLYYYSTAIVATVVGALTPKKNSEEMDPNRKK